MNQDLSKEEHIKFAGEVDKILHLMIHSLYTNKDIFLRELISNSSDACDKLRYLSITQPELVKDDSEFNIKISTDEEKRTITISDNGIGMSRQDLIDNIGTIARSGTQKFFDKLTSDATQNLQLIGQFGVGFYSGFMVAEEIEVITRKAGEKDVWQWKSKGEGEYTLKKLDDAEHIGRGTSVILHLKAEEDDFLDKFRIRHITKIYSDHINFPIHFLTKEGQIETLNSVSAIWMRPKSEITAEQYQEFYKQVSHLPDDPWHIMHNKNEGVIEYTNLLYIPSTKPFDLFNPNRNSKVKLYVKKVFIGDENIQLTPAYMRFLHGVIDSEDLPLNISRETLQHNNSLEKIRKSVTNKVINELKNKLEKDPEDYQLFWNNFGSVLKEGLCESMPAHEKEKLLEVCLFRSSLHNKYISLAEYINNMKPNQNNIFYLSGDTVEKAQNSPQLEGFIKNDIDVLLFTDTVDDFWVSVLNSYKDKEMKSVTRSGIELDKISNPTQENETADSSSSLQNNQTLIDHFKQTLASLVSDVKISGKLVDSPVCLAVAEGAMDIRMERYLKDQKQLGHSFAKIIEINVNHPVIKRISNAIDANDTNLAQELELALFDQACILEGEPVNDLAGYSKRMNNLLGKI